MKYLIDKETKILQYGVAVDNFEFNQEVYELIETDLQPINIVNKWQNNVWIESATEEEIAEANKAKVPKSVKSIAFLIALEFIGITKDAVLSFIETLPSPNNIIVKHSFERATFFERSSPFIPMVGQAFNKTDAELENVFFTAREIEKQLNL